MWFRIGEQEQRLGAAMIDRRCLLPPLGTGIGQAEALVVQEGRHCRRGTAHRDLLLKE